MHQPVAHLESATTAGFAYPAPPENCPPDLAKPAASYKRHAWLAMLGLAGFGLLYLALTLWFGWSAYYYLSRFLDGGGDILELIQGIGSLLVAVFFAKGLFFRKPSGVSKDYEITREQQPRLFEFLDKLAAETKAPRPHKVFLSDEVNACVFYDLSILDFLFPRRKNLEIGLGLVNSLSLIEFKAVLAHEFGHFAQSTMAVGRWVYIAQQVATQLIFHRDWFDELLAGVSRIDLRVAWIGWLLRIIIWALRSILDTLLSFVMLAHRALSREMEYQADLVAVANTGSDPLIHALHRLAPADDAWSETRSFVNEELKRGHVPEDLFAVQSRILEHKRRILNDPEYGQPPVLPAEKRDAHRIFTPELAQPPQMWSTHPANHLREANAKKRYVASALDERSAWCLFDRPDELRRDFTSHTLAHFEKTVRPPQETAEQLDRDYRKHYLNPDYRGTYLGRSIVSRVATPAELYAAAAPARDELYPRELTDVLEKHRNLAKEHALLRALRNRAFEPVDGVIRFRGKVIKRGDLGEAIDTVRADLDASDDELAAHDRKCRTYFRERAHEQARGWPLYLEGVLALVHYADHGLRNLIDAHSLFQNTLAVVLADGSVSSKEIQRVLRDGNEVYRVLAQLHAQRDQVLLDTATAGHLKAPAWADNFEALRLPSPQQSNLSEWTNAVPGWVMELASALHELRAAALETLLECEAFLDRAARGELKPDGSPAPPRLPANYEVLIEGKERTLQTKLNFWDSFQTASGTGPATLRFLAAAAIVCGAIWLTVSKSSLEALKAALAGLF